MGLIFDIKRYAIHDGPGIRTTVFFKGCPLTCLWCHNPEGKSKEPEFMWSKERCIQCKSCESVCPEDAISFSDSGYIQIDKNKCNLCKACVDACHSQALELIGKEMTVTQVLEEIEKDILFYDESKGGVTFSGGEPLMQPDFLLTLLKACKNHKIHTTVDTCGYVPPDVLFKISEYTDLFLYDVKVINDETHKKVTGVSNALILDNLRKLSIMKKIIVRFPLIPGVNDSEKDVAELGGFISSIHLKEVSILPYHTGGVEKIKKLQTSQNSHVYHPLSAEALDDVEKVLKRYNLKTKRGG